jgi:two-component system, OmpR family, KDP operon response regulator KdpE
VSGARLLLVEDDLATRRLIAANLRLHGYQVDEAGEVRSARESWDRRRPDLVILDLGLPDRDGTALIGVIRRDGGCPILVVSARGNEADKIDALDRGADDFVSKPVGLGELRARIAALLRRAAGPGIDLGGRLVVGPLSLDPRTREVLLAGRPVDLTPREYELLKTMLAQPERVLTRARLLRAVWGTDYADEAHYLHVYVSRLRRKLEAADPDGLARGLIEAEAGVGYRVRVPPNGRDEG